VSLLSAWQLESRNYELYSCNEHDSRKNRKSQSGSKSENLSIKETQINTDKPRNKSGAFYKDL